ncbi:hypothetical protein DMN91_012282 [Ooceraea biroi]|uniref:Vesicular, overexpressed in cancer, prosurvival protein 1 n=2 Tax=Ooceraea biroi TaxID=2015173 RepID=A0A3L8D613_OOCBI|nr:uncharacterized protein LOC113563306 [Ooceraea biroi]RLU15288.1 hypothetical protein DMN91_012282 [Ooceraea biroi]
MEYLSNIITSFLLVWIFAVSTTTAHYCVWGLCESWEYCCDENVCCSSKDYDIWITLVIIAGVVIGMVVAGTCLYYNIRRIYLYLQRRYHGINSVSMPAEFEPDGRSIKVSFQE